MRPITVTQGAAGVSAWVPLDIRLVPTNVSLGCTLTSGGTLTYKAQYTFDNLGLKQPCSITRSTTTATLILPDHGITGVTDSIIVGGSGSSNLDGTYQVASIVDANTITYTVANTGATAALTGVWVVILRVFDHATITGRSANFDGVLSAPASAVRLNVTAYTNGKVSMTVNSGGR